MQCSANCAPGRKNKYAPSLNAQNKKGIVEDKKSYFGGLELETLLAGLAHLYALSPFRIEHLVRTDASVGGWVEYAVNDVTATSLCSVSGCLQDGGHHHHATRTLCSVSMGA
jgi:hypothetical protein